MSVTCKYICSECGKEFEITPDVMVCPVCSKEQKVDEPLRGILEVQYFPKEQASLEDLCPVEGDHFPKIPVGHTALWKSDNLGAGIYLKDDTMNLTGSFKDRASILVAAFAKKFNIDEIVLASTGNAGSSMAGVAAACGLKATVFLPKTAPKAKMVQALQYGANLITVDGNYDDAFDLSLEYSKTHHLLSRNTAYNPLTIEGKKTVSFELFQQLGKAPNYVFVPVGDGVILSGVYKGFKDLMHFGFIEKMPTIIAVQAEGSSAIHDALERGSFEKVTADTVADSIAVDVPRCGYYALKQLQKYNGRSVVVSDEDILSAQKELSEKTGLFAEPAAASSYAGYLRLENTLKAGSTSVLLITGTGLKDIDAAMKSLAFPAKHVKTIEDVS